MPCGLQVLNVVTYDRATSTYQRIDLALGRDGLYLTQWRPNIAGLKQGGVWRDSPLAHGRRLVMATRANAVDQFELIVSAGTQDRVATSVAALRELLDKAVNYWTVDWQDEPVWLEAQASTETNPRYALIYAYAAPEDGDQAPEGVFERAVAGALGYRDWPLQVEHGPWLDNEPGASECVEIAGTQEDWELWQYAGTTWQVNAARAPNPLNVIADFGACMLAAGLGQIDRTVNGTAWAGVALADPNAIIMSMAQATDGYIYAAGYQAGAPNLPRLYRSNDCGVTWPAAPNIVGTLNPHALVMASDGYLYCCCDANLGPGGLNGLFRCTPGGVWAQVGAGVIALPTAICETPEGALVVAENVPGGVTFYRSEDGGATWTEHGAYSTLTTVRHIFAPEWDYEEEGKRAVFFNSQLLAGGTGGMMIADDGIRWADVTAAGMGDIWTIIRRGEYVWACDSQGDVWRTRDGIEWTIGGTIGAVTPLRGMDVYEGNDRIYVGRTATGDIYWSPLSLTMGRTATCEDEVYVECHYLPYNLTTIYNYDASGPTWTACFPHTAFPMALLPAVPAVGDAIYFTVDSAIYSAGAPPFLSLAFDIETPLAWTGAAPTLVWEYSLGGGAWQAFAATEIEDHTAGGGVPFTTVGVCSVHWRTGTVNPWAPDAVGVPAVTGLWVRCRVTAVGGGITQAPTQANRDIYTISWSDVEIAEDEVGGDLPALFQARGVNVGALQVALPNAVSTGPGYINRWVCGLRSVDRGEEFQAYLNADDQGLVPGVAVVAGTNCAFVTSALAPTGRAVRYTPAGVAAEAMANRCQWTLAPGLAEQYYGTYHAFVAINATAAGTLFNVRLLCNTPFGGARFLTDPQNTDNGDLWAVMDFGEVQIPVSDIFAPGEVPYATRLNVQAEYLGGAGTEYLEIRCLVLIPVDEWSVDALDVMDNQRSWCDVTKLAHIDSITHPKKPLRTLVKQVGTDALYSIYRPVAPGPAQLQAGERQRLWWYADRLQLCEYLTSDRLRCYEEACAFRLTMERVQRYHSLRGDK